MQKEITGLTVRPEKEHADKFKDVCKAYGVMPSVILKNLVIEIANTGKIPTQYVPDQVLERMRKALEDHEKIKFLLGDSDEAK